ncbi:MAG: hypothetical protein ABDH31_06360 [Chlorobiota bacterium]
MRYVIGLTVLSVALWAQVRIAVLPFRNMDGDLRYNLWCYRFADSISTLLSQADTARQHYLLIPRDSLELVLGELNLDPTTPQYDSDIWKAAQVLRADKVVTGNFNLLPGKILVNAYIYDIRTKREEASARNLYRSEERAAELPAIIVARLLPHLTHGR